MVTDGQRLGVLTGQFIRAQRLCSTMRQFKAGVQKIAWAVRITTKKDAASNRVRGREESRRGKTKTQGKIS